VPGGAEHYVETSGDGMRMVKHTDEGFGFTVDAEIAPFGGVLNLRVALPSEYLERLDITNDAFGDDQRFEGFSLVAGEAGFVISQRAIVGVIPNMEEVERWMADQVFKVVSP
jgi:hypothetical protein